jgi:hypothetical protein
MYNQRKQKRSSEKNLLFRVQILEQKKSLYTVIPLYSEPGYSEYPLIVNDFLCTEHSIVETNGE